MELSLCDVFISFSVNQDLTIETELEAANGKKVKAIEIFACALMFFKDHALQVC